MEMEFLFYSLLVGLIHVLFFSTYLLVIIVIVVIEFFFIDVLIEIYRFGLSAFPKIMCTLIYRFDHFYWIPCGIKWAFTVLLFTIYFFLPFSFSSFLFSFVAFSLSVYPSLHLSFYLHLSNRNAKIVATCHISMIHLFLSNITSFIKHKKGYKSHNRTSCLMLLYCAFERIAFLYIILL